jgi:hypothetical protein
MERKSIGKIQSATFGMGGYQDAMIGVSWTLGSDKECWGVGDFWGAWATRKVLRAALCVTTAHIGGGMISRRNRLRSGELLTLTKRPRLIHCITRCTSAATRMDGLPMPFEPRVWPCAMPMNN